MKLKYIISALFAGAALFVACTEENPIKVSELTANLSPSVVGLDVAEGTATVTINSAEAWTASTDSTWVHFSPASGGAGTTDVVVTVDENKGRERTAVITVVSAGVKSLLTVIQAGVPHGLLPDDPLTPTEAKERCTALDQGASAPKPYYVKGVVCRVVELSPVGKYNNVTFWLDEEADGDGLFEVYRAKWLENGDVPSEDCVHVGDIVMVYGTIMNYKGTAETSQGNAYVYSIEEGETPSISLEADQMSVADTDTEARFTVKANNLTEKITISTTATWLTGYTQELESTGGEVVVTFDANTTTENRTAEFTISNSEVEEPLTFTLTQNKPIDKGTADTPFSVAEAIEFCLAQSSATTVKYYVKGKFVKWNKDTDAFGANTYGNAAFWISEDGQDYLTAEGKNDTSKMFEAYQVLWLGNKSWAEGDGTVGVGDEVVICGPLTKYNTTAETTGKGTAYIYSLNGYTAWEAGISSTAPLTIGEAITKALATSEPTPLQYFVKGKFVKWNKDADAYGANTYGNASFWLSEDGQEYLTAESNNDTSKMFEAYQVYWLGGKKWEDGNHTLTAGDDVVIRGQLTKYNGTAETTGKGAACVFSVNGKLSETDWSE